MATMPGSFQREVKCGGATFYVSMMTVGQYMDIISSGALKDEATMKTLFIDIALASIKGWDNIYDYESGEPLGYSEEVLMHDIPVTYLALIGQQVWKELASLSEEEVKYLRGYIRFIYYISDDKNKERAKYFECEKCVESGAWRSKNCGKSEDFRKEIQERLGIQEQARKQEKERTGKTPFNMEAFKAKYGAKKINKGGPRLVRPETASRQAETRRDTFSMTLNKFKYPECPVSWIPDEMKEWGDKIYYCVKNEIPFFSGGLADQPNRVFEIMKVVQGESNKIESESMKEQTK